ncbi:carbohydrate ABC transporter permease [Candidatus Omnitrophota bacterium]
MDSKPNFFQEIFRQRVSYLFIAPAVILFSVFVLIPVVTSLFLSFTEYNILSAPRWVGLGNYREIFLHDARFWKALGNTAIYVIGVVPISIGIALLLAVAIDQKIRFKNFYKTMFFMPVITSVVAYSVIWKWLFAGEKYGLINHWLIKIGLQPIEWLISPTWTLPAIIIMSIWAGLGYNMILLLVGLQTIPNTFYEAAEVDGANAWYKFWRITVPLLRPTLLFVSIMSVINSFQVFEQVYIVTGGTGEGVGGVLDSALSLVAYLYERGFQRFEMGYASAIAYILFGLILIATLLNLKFGRPRFEY